MLKFGIYYLCVIFCLSILISGIGAIAVKRGAKPPVMDFNYYTGTILSRSLWLWIMWEVLKVLK